MTYKTVKITSTVSTNADLKRMAADGAELGTVLVAKRQSGGRGRLERSFSSESGGLYMSIILPYNKEYGASGITITAAVVVSRAIERLAPVTVGIKWVNDLLVNGKKVCGILAEAVTVGSECRVILGVGINLTNKIPSELSDIASNLFDLCGAEISADGMLSAVLDELSGIEAVEFENILDQYRHKCVILGQKIDVIPHSGEKYSAFAVDVLHDGSLLVKKQESGEEIRIFSGEVSSKISEDAV